jgi:hypothetical protein
MGKYSILTMCFPSWEAILKQENPGLSERLNHTNRKGGCGMKDQQAPEFSEGDVQSLGKKLAEFSRTLAPGELAALTQILQQAMPDGSDVQGFSYETQSDPIDRRLLVVGLLDILYPDDFDAISSEG